MASIIISERITLTYYISAVQKRNTAVLLRKPGRLASQYAAGSTKTIEYDDSEYHFDQYASIAVGVFSYHTVTNQTKTLAAEQVTFRKSDGSTIYPTDEETEIRSMDSEDYNEARKLKFGFSENTIQYYAESFYMMPEGYYITDVEPNSMAEQAGLQVGDVVISYDGDKVNYPYATEYAKLKILAGETVEVKYWRGNKEYTTQFSLDEDEDNVQDTDTSSDNTEQHSVASELLKLSELLEKGILTQEEFDKQKAKLLNN